MCLILSQSRRCLYIALSWVHVLVRTQEHALTDKESIIYKHLRDCDNIKHIQDLYNLSDIFTNENISSTTVINKEFFAQTVCDNTNIIDRDDNWNLLLYKEAYHIKRLTPFLDNGLKATRELRLFSWQFRFFVFHFHVIILLFNLAVFKILLPVSRLSPKMI